MSGDAGCDFFGTAEKSAGSALTILFAGPVYVDLHRTVTLSGDTTLDVALERTSPPRFPLSGTIKTLWNQLLDDVGV